MSERLPPAGSRRASLASRAAAAMTVVALVAVLLTGLVALRLIPQAAEQQARDALAAQADLVATSIERETVRLPDGSVGRVRLARLLELLGSQQITVAVLRPDGRGPAGAVDPVDAEAVAAGRTVSTVRTLGDRRTLVEGRPVDGGGGVLLLQPASVVRSSAANARRTLLLAMLVGLGGAAVAGVLLARRLARPLKHVAAATRRLSTGARDVRVQPEGPAELAAVAEAINQLTGALATSEGRQREFLLSVSHELRTPLTAIRGYAEAIADDLVPADDLPATGTTMLGEARRLDRLVSDLLDLARLGAEGFRLDLGEVDLTDLVRQAATVWRDRGSADGVEFRTEVPDAPLVVRTDATRVRQIIDGLAENALRVTPTGAPIVLACRADGAGTALVQVRDGGPGLTPDDLAVAFERSALYDRYRGVRRVGTGVGLALVAGLAGRLGGAAEASTAAEGGACFTVRLPVAGPGT